VQYLPGAIGTAVTDDNFSSAAYFNGNIYYMRMIPCDSSH